LHRIDREGAPRGKTPGDIAEAGGRRGGEQEAVAEAAAGKCFLSLEPTTCPKRDIYRRAALMCAEISASPPQTKLDLMEMMPGHDRHPSSHQSLGNPRGVNMFSSQTYFPLVAFKCSHVRAQELHAHDLHTHHPHHLIIMCTSSSSSTSSSS
jgi:hypothetical protein